MSASLHRIDSPLTLAEILEALEDTASEYTAADIYICPPDNDDPHNITDEESGEEDSNDPDRVCRRQLQAEAEIQFEVIENDEDTPIELGDERIGNDCTGTVRANRTEKCPLNDKKMMFIRERGSFKGQIT
ncbi:hypothetical protein J6590_098285 [Homalodisca vitripennis]|nr:hypothetical protein J6590_098285 [Homalodisca vitripennis]